MEEKSTKYATNKTYMYEALSSDTPVIQRLRDDGEFWVAKKLQSN